MVRGRGKDGGLSTTVYGVWIGAAFGWGIVGARLYRGLNGRTRVAGLVTHGVTPVAALLLCSLLGIGFLYATIALAAQWWALTLASGLRPERLVDPGDDALALLAVWLTASGLLAHGLTALIV
jgi:hypothetical protein